MRIVKVGTGLLTAPRDHVEAGRRQNSKRDLLVRISSAWKLCLTVDQIHISVSVFILFEGTQSTLEKNGKSVFGLVHFEYPAP